MITDEGLQWMADIVAGVEPEPKILYLAWGTGTTPEAAGDVQLEAEAGRKAVSARDVGALGEAITDTFLGTDDAVGDIEEWGWFGGDATSAANSGRLISRWLSPESKSSLETILVNRTDKVQRGV